MVDISDILMLFDQNPPLMVQTSGAREWTRVAQQEKGGGWACCPRLEAMRPDMASLSVGIPYKMEPCLQ